MQKKVMLYTLVLLGLMFASLTVFAFIYKYKTPAKKANKQNIANIAGTLSFYNENNEVLSQINIELADNEFERAKGLMYREIMPENQGMLFVFDYEQDLGFWMKNTLISLDMIYLNADKEVVSIAYNTKIKSTQTYPSEKPAKYVIEVNAGFCEKYAITKGCKVNWQLN